MYASLAKALAASTYRQTGYRLDTDVGLMCSIALCGGDVWGGGGGGGVWGGRGGQGDCMRPWPRRVLHLPKRDRIEARHCCRVDVFYGFVWWGCWGGRGGKEEGKGV